MYVDVQPNASDLCERVRCGVMHVVHAVPGMVCLVQVHSDPAHLEQCSHYVQQVPHA